ncbi:MAG: DUF2905 family protein [Acidobacteriota bacterium]
MIEIGKLLIISGIVLLVAGAVFYFGGSLLGLGRLPGDLAFRRGNFSFYFPIVTCLLLSLLLSLLFYLFRRY